MKKLLAATVILMLLGIIAQAGELPFAASQVIGALTDVEDMVPADLDGDGDFDLVATGPGVEWHENLGGAMTWTEHEISASFAGLAIAAADIDGDGDLDVVGSAAMPGGLQWFENLAGDATTWTAHAIGVADGTGIAVGDLDGDGDTDIVNKDYWWENLGGGGSWGAAYLALSYDAAIGDLDGDGDNDVAGADIEGNGLWWAENATGDASSMTVQTIDASILTRSVKLGDFDRDGALDIAMADDSGGVSWWRWTGPGPADWTEVVTVDLVDRQRLGEPVDFDGDGDVDLLVSSEIGSTHHWLENSQGDGSAWNSRLIDSGMSNMNALAAVDLDGDGDPDPVGTGYAPDSSRTLWWPNLTIHRSAFYEQDGSVIAPALVQAYSVTTADIDGDGDLDPVTIANSGSRTSWWVNDGSPEVGDWTEMLISSGDSGGKEATPGDLDNDGDLDVVIVATGEIGSLNWFESDGTPQDGGWTGHTMLASAMYFDAVTVDMDADGDLDVVYVVKAALGSVGWAENDGSPAVGPWTEHILASDLAGAITAAAGDMDGDGDIDIVAGGIDAPGEIRWWESDGSPADGGWTEHQVVTGLDSVEDVVISDLDLDGDLDIVAALASLTDIRWWQSDGTPADGGWSEHFVANWHAIEISVGDADADGDLDILGAGNAGNGADVRWFESDGTPADGGWAEHTLTAGFSRGAHFADLDHDGDLDALCAETGGGKVLWWPNLGGQLALPTADAVVDEHPLEDSEVLVLQIDLNHRGRAGDDGVELATLELAFEKSAGEPLSAAQLNNLADRIYFYLDDGDGSWDVQDAVVQWLDAPFTLTGGVMTVVLPDDNLDLQTGAGSAKTYFLTVDLTASSGTVSPDTIVVSHLTASSSTGEMASTDLPLALESHPDTAAATIEVNAAPVVDTAIGTQITVANEAVVIDINPIFSDPDRDDLSFSATGLPASLSLSDCGIISGTPSAADVAGSPYPVTVTASDSWGASIDDNFNLIVMSEQAMYSSAQLYWTMLDGEVWRSHADGSSLQMVVGSTGEITTLVFDATNEHLYYATEDPDRQGFLFRCELDGSHQQRLVSGLDEIDDMELDPIAGKIYWSEAGSRRIRRANLDGSGVETLVSGVQNLRALGLDLEAETLYFGDLTTIYVADLDGSGATQIVTDAGIREIEVDTVNDKLYYARGNRTRWCDLDGTNCADLANDAPTNLEISGSFVYFSTTDHDLWRMDLDGGNLQQVSSGLEMPRRFALGTDDQMYLADGSIRRYDLDGSNGTSIAAGAGEGVHDVAVDMAGRRFFFSDFEQDAVVTRSFGSSDLLHLSTVPASATEIRGLALHPEAGQLYWAQTKLSPAGIWRMDLDGSALDELVTGLEYPHDVALDTSNSKVYWTEKIDSGSESTGVIRRASLDGSGIEDVLTGLSNGIRGLAVDDVNGMIYWTDHRNDEIWRADRDGGSPEVVLSGVDSPHDIAIDPAAGFLYWTEGIESASPTGGLIRRANLDGSSVVDIHTGLSNMIRDLTVVIPVQSFTLTLSSVTGDGTVTAPAGLADGISCGFDGEDNCDEIYLDGAAVTLTASPEPGWVFASWGGDNDCLDGILNITADVSCSASFVLNADLIFHDGFESGDTTMWSTTLRSSPAL